MNAKAKSLGMTNTSFSDPTGLTSRNVSTPRDLFNMVSAAHHYPEIHQFSTSQQYSFISNITGNELVYRNSNPLTYYDGWNIGVTKTGYIREAGKCLVMQTVINGSPVVIVLLNATGKENRVGNAKLIKEWMESSPYALLNAG
jgi:D-alanyl-D-alanine endopeptidase (penicillin-binding protein 7)